jgi:RNA polymerase sigma-70 factor (ECF subfamily)
LVVLAAVRVTVRTSEYNGMRARPVHAIDGGIQNLTEFSEFSRAPCCEHGHTHHAGRRKVMSMNNLRKSRSAAPRTSATATADGRLEALYRLHSGPLLNYLVRLTLGDRRQAEDILQETYLRAWHFLQDSDETVENMRPWLYTVARRVLIDAGRKRKARPAEVIVTDLRQLPGSDDPIERLLIGQTVRAGLKTLDSEHRMVLVESYFRDRSVREIAALLDIPEGTVKSRTHYALRALRVAVDGLPS